MQFLKYLFSTLILICYSCIAQEVSFCPTVLNGVQNVLTSPFGGQKAKLSDHKYNVYSQFGEDGIIERIFSIMGTTSKIAIEFGGADGFSCSNTANLWTKDWKGFLVEAAPHLFEQLSSNVARYDCIPIYRKIDVFGENTIESLAKEYNMGAAIDLLSIDVDGDDYYIFQTMQNLRPRLIICEFNPSIPAHLDIYSDYGHHIGCSVAALERIALEKGYTLVALTDANCFFVVNEEYPKFANYDTDPKHLFTDRYIAYVISDYSGNYKVIGPEKFVHPWGWSGHSSIDDCHGDVVTIPATIKME